MTSEVGPGGSGIDRFWCPTDGSYSLDDHGFLADPEQTWFGSSSTNPDAKRLDAFIEDRCLVLLGEPGTGKSTAVRSRPLAPPSTTDHVVDLASYGSEDRLVREVFHSPTVLSWRAGTHHLSFTLDSLDEARTRIPHVGEIVADQLRRLPVDRLLLRIACRTADWPTALGGTLSELFGAIVELEILPLRQRDAAALASRWCDPASFMNAIRAAGAGPLAARPITLGFLGRAFGRTGNMPHRGAELYAAGVRQLCEEQNPRRSDALHGDSSSLEERLIIAQRAAAASIFGGKTAVWIGPDTQAGEDDATIVELIGTSGHRASPDRRDSNVAAREILRTALFSGRGEHRLGWAHATFADYLAADWVTRGGLGPDQTRALFLAPDGNCWPQTRLAAGWAVAIAPDRFKFLIHSDPGAFRGEVELPGDELRAAVIDGLLKNVDSANVRPWESSYHALRHAGIADQLRAHFTDPDPGRRRLALQLARECIDLNMHDDLVEIALDATLDLADRVAAASALEQLPNEHRTSALRELALSDHIAGDTDDDLRGSALLASWPHAITTAEVLQALRPRRRSNYLGTYAHFLSRLREAIAVDDVTPGLGWILDNVALPAQDDLLGALANAIMRLGRGTQVPRTDLVEAVSRVIELRAHDYQSLLYEDLTDQDSDVLDDVALRRAVVLNILRVPPSEETLFHMSSIGNGQLSAVRAEDFGWLCEISKTADEQLLKATRRLALWTFDVTMVDHRDYVFRMAASHPLSTDFAKSWLDAVDLNQPDTIQLREIVQRRNSRLQGFGTKDQVGEDISALLQRYRSGESETFWQATRLLYVPPNSRHYRDEQDPDPVKIPRWNTLSRELHEHLMNAAEEYLQNESCRTPEWLTKPNIRYFPAEAGYRAMIMLLRARPEALAQLKTSAWVEWAPALAVAFRTAYVNGADRKDKEKLLNIAGPTGRQAARSALLLRLQASDESGTRPLLSDEAEMLWDPQLSSAISALIDRATSADVRDEMVELLAKMSFNTVRPRLGLGA